MMFDQVGTDDAVAFYRRTWFVVMALLFVTPLGLILLWTVSDLDTRSKVMATLAIAGVPVVFLLLNILL
jgi:hypothetical protein